MSVDLSDYVDTLRREISPPGSTAFTAVSDDILTGYLSDAFWEVKLDGFNVAFVADADGIVVPAGDAQVANVANGFETTDYDVAKDMGRDQIALVCLYAGIKILRNKLLESNTRIRAKAGPVEYEADNSANLLVEMLKELQDTRRRLLFLKTYNQDVYLVDAFSARSTSAASYSGYLYDWYAGAFGSPNSDMYYDTGIV